MLPELGCTHALLLQGPAGPFMRRFSEDLRAHGIDVTKVNFHAGEVLYYRGPTAVAFRGRFEEWPEFVRDLITRRGIDAIFLFGDCRPLHRAAIAVARELGVRVWVFEEGYLRPDWITLEADGVNGYSKMPRDPAFFRALDLPELDPPIPVGDTFGQNAWYSTLSALAFTHLNQGFPHYVHHRELNAWHHTYRWVRDFFRKRYLRAREAPMLERVQRELDRSYFFVPLQVYCDYQLVHSPYDDLMEFVDEVLEAFVATCDARVSIVFKQHPLDRAYKDWGPDFELRRQRFGLSDRLHYVHDLHLPTLLKHAIGTVTINSTVGLSSIHHGTPVKVMGTAVYDMPGLTHQGSLESFFERPTAPDRALYEKFRRWLLHANQINGTFYKRLPGFGSGIGVVWFPGVPRERKKKKLSVVVPIRASEENSFVVDRLRAVLRFFAGYEDAECIVVDSESPEPYAAQIKAACSSAGATFVKDPAPSHPFAPGAVRNAGARRASAEHLLFWDVDLCAGPDLVPRILRWIDEPKDDDAFLMIPCLYATRDASEAIEGHGEPVDLTALQRSFLEGEAHLVSHLAASTSTIVVRRDHFDRLGGNRTEYVGHGCEDFDLLHRLASRWPRGKRGADYYEDHKTRAIGDYRGFRAYLAGYALPHLFDGLYTAHLWHPRPLERPYHRRRKANEALLASLLRAHDSNAEAWSKEGVVPAPTIGAQIAELMRAHGYDALRHPGLYRFKEGAAAPKGPRRAKLRKLVLRPRAFLADSSVPALRAIGRFFRENER